MITQCWLCIIRCQRFAVFMVLDFIGFLSKTFSGVAFTVKSLSAHARYSKDGPVCYGTSRLKSRVCVNMQYALKSNKE